MASASNGWTFHVPDLGISIRMEAHMNRDEFKKVRNRINRELRDTKRKVAQETFVPVMDARARYVTTITGRGMVARKGTAGSVYLTTLARGKKKQTVGYLEFGGENPGKKTRRRIVPDEITPQYVGVSQKGHLVGPKVKGGKRRRSRSNRSHAGAVSTPQGPRAWVNNPRKFAGKHMLGKTMRSQTPAFRDRLSDRLLDYFQTEGFDIQR